MLAGDDLIGAVFHAFGNLVHGFFMLKMPAHFAKIVQRHAGHVGAGPGGDFAVPMLADDEGVHAAAVHLQMLAQQIFQPRGVQHRAGADHPVFRHAGIALGGLGEDVHGVGHHQQHALAPAGAQFVHDGLHDGHVFLHQLQPGFAGLLRRAGGDDDHGGVGGVVIGAGVDLHGLGEGQAVADVQRFALGPGGIGVDERQLGEQAALHQRERRGRAHKPAAHDGRLAKIDFCQRDSLLYSFIPGQAGPALVVHIQEQQRGVAHGVEAVGVGRAG